MDRFLPENLRAAVLRRRARLRFPKPAIKEYAIPSKGWANIMGQPFTLGEWHRFP